jgi:CubicO group peptidase (beta-lactamase class C family)
MLVVAAAGAATRTARAQDAATLPDSTIARIDALFARWHAPTDPGCAVAAARDGRTILQRAYGMASLEDGVLNTPATIFEGGSVSKQFTAAAVLRLAQRGRLSLEDDVRKYVPELPDYGTPIRLRHMLNHTSGLRDWGTVVDAAGWPRGSRVHTHAHVLDILSRQRELNFPPGSEYSYSNSNYNLLAIIVARVSGMPFAEFTRKELFEPLGMTSTSWRDDYTRIVPGRSTAYDRRDGQWHLDMPFENVHGNGGLLTTVDDLLRWNRSFTDSTLGPAFVREMERRGRLTNGGVIRYALGLSLDEYRGVPEVSHSGATAGYRAFLARYPRQRLDVALLCNAGNAGTTSLTHQIVDILLASELGPTTPDAIPAVTLTPAALAARAGLYRSERDRTSLRIVADHGALHLEDGAPLRAMSDSAFRVGAGPTVITFRGGAAPSARMLWPTRDADTTRYVRVEPWRPTRAELLAFAGEYASDEADVSYRVAVDSGKLVLRWRPDGEIAIEPVYRDTFAARGAGIVWFHRDRRGRITGLSVGLGRARDIRFRKTG